MQNQLILPNTSQWNYSQFKLRLILTHPNIQILSISKNPNIHSHFLQKDKYFKIDAAIDTTQLNENEINNLKHNINRGVNFKCGRIIQNCIFEDRIGQPKIYKIIMFKIILKQVLSIYQENSISRQDLLTMTQQYDSVYLSTRKQEITVYDHNYFIKSQHNYVWEYEIQYRYVNVNQLNSKIHRWTPELEKCDQCLVNKAYWHCIDQKLKFCIDCYDDVHKGKNRLAHKKQPINPFNCHRQCEKPAHNQNLLQFYCFNCKSLKCSKCLSDKYHTADRNSVPSQRGSLNSQQIRSRKSFSHQFIQVRKLIQVLRQKQTDLNSQLKSRLILKIKQVQGVIAKQTKVYENKLNKLQQELVLQITNLKKQSKRQINKTVTIHSQLKRKFDEVLWIQKFVQYNQEVLDAKSNIQLKEIFASFVTNMNAEQYFRKIQIKIDQLMVGKN